MTGIHHILTGRQWFRKNLVALPAVGPILKRHGIRECGRLPAARRGPVVNRNLSRLTDDIALLSVADRGAVATGEVSAEDAGDTNLDEVVSLDHLNPVHADVVVHRRHRVGND